MTPPKDQAPELVERLKHLSDYIARNFGGGADVPLLIEAAERIEQLEAENAELRGKLEKAEKTLTTAMQLAAMDLREQANIRSPTQNLVRDQYNPEDEG